MIQDGKGKAVLRFADNEYWKNVKDGIFRNISITYDYLETPKIIKPQRDGDKWKIYVTKWRLLEVSVVSMPRDDLSTGIGRSYINDLKNKENDMAKKVTGNGHATNENEAASQENKQANQNDSTSNQGSSQRSVVSEGRNFDYERIREISDMAAQHGRTDLIPKYINERSLSVKDLANEMLSDVRRGRGQGQASYYNSNEPQISENSGESIGINERESRQFSFANAIKSTILDTREGFELEYDVMKEMRQKENAPRSSIIIPLEVMQAKRDFEGMSSGESGHGSDYIQTTVDTKSFIDVLREKTILDKLGADMRTGLKGNVVLPGAGNDVVASFLGETEEIKDPTKLETYGIPLSPKRIAALTYYSRTILDQSSINIESSVRDQLARAVARTLDRAAIFGEGRADANGKLLEPIGLLKKLKDYDNVAGRDAEDKRFIVAPKGKLVDYNNIIELETRIATENADIGKLTYVTSTRGRGFLKSIAELEQSGKRVWTESRQRGWGEINGYNGMATTMWGEEDKKTLIIFGNWADVVIGTWGSLRLDLEEIAKKDSIEAVVNLKGDTAIKRPVSFAAMYAPIRL